MAPSSVMTITLLLLLSFAGSTKALCECGYSTTNDATGDSVVFTDLIESDFLHLRNISVNTDWRPQNFSVTANAGRGPYGMNFSTPDVLSNPIQDHHNWVGPGEHGGDAGLQLVVRGGTPPNGYVPVAQMDSVRQDLLWGSYRTSLKLTPFSGTCSSFFWYFNNSQEIDMEFLSSQFSVENNTYPVNLVLQSEQSARQGFSAQGTGNYVVANLPFNPTEAFHEYRIDFIPGRVVFYADSKVLAVMNTTAVPTEAGHMILNQWSNGNKLWSSGPPVTDATMTISYVKAYFNSSDPDRQKSHISRCKDGSVPGAVCPVPKFGSPAPELLTVPISANEFFFTDQPDMANGQIYHHKSGCLSNIHRGYSSALFLFSWCLGTALSLEILFS